MFKPLAIVAVLGSFATAATAQSTVTIFGLVDLSAQHLRSGSQSRLSGGHLNRLADGVIYGPGSRWGIRVSEDLGSGLVARVLLENGFNADTGTLGQGGRAFGRQAYLALGSPSAGELRLGRQYALHDETMAVLNPTGNITPVNPGGPYTLPAGNIQLFIDASRVDNAIHYLSPDFAGFRAQAMLALGESTMDRYEGLKANYVRGGFTAALAYEQSKAIAPTAGKSTVNKLLEVGGNYNFGPVALFAGYEHAKDLTAGPASQTQVGTLTLPGLSGPATQLSAYNIGVAVPFGLTDFYVNHTMAKYSNSSGDATIGRASLGARYLLSKRTALYGTVALATGNQRDSVSEKQLYQLGVRHSF